MKIIKDLKSKYSDGDIEAAFVQFYISSRKIHLQNNSLIGSIVQNQNDNVSAIKRKIKDIFKNIYILDLVKVFELLIVDEDRKVNGAFFTPHLISRFIVHETVKVADLKICDPSCGCGAFLVEVVNKIHREFNKSVVETIEGNLYGVDIADYSVRRCKILLTLLALENGEDVRNINFNIVRDDSLEVDWNALFPEVFSNGGFDVVIGNPPYVKFQDLQNSLRKKLYDNWLTLKKGNYNLYFAFFELGIKLLRDDGILGYITPNNYFTSISGVYLREFLSENKYIYKIVDFNHLKLFDAQTYTCVSFLNKESKETFLYEKIQKDQLLKNLFHLKYSKIHFNSLNNKKWRLLRSKDQENIGKIENAAIRLGDLVDIRVGIATCKDAIYFIDGNTLKDGYYQKRYNSKNYFIETDVTRPVVKISDFKDQKSLDNNKRRIIFPYNLVGSKMEIIPEDDFKEKHPQCYKYFVAVKEELSTRDKGKTEYPAWYAYARTQGLGFRGERLLTPTFSSKPRFLYSKSKKSLFCNGYGIFLREKQNLFNIRNFDLCILSKILNSRIMDYYIRNTSVSIQGGYPCYQKNFIELFGLPFFSDEDVEFLKKEDNRKKIDEFLICKYGIETSAVILGQTSENKYSRGQERNLEYLNSSCLPLKL